MRSEGSPVGRAPGSAPGSEAAKPVHNPAWAPWWVCYEAARKEGPWVLRSYRQSKPDTRQRGYFGRKEAVRRLGRLRVLWEKWMFIATLKLIPEEKWSSGFTEAEYLEAAIDLEGRRRVRLALLDVRRLARQCGLDPDDVAYQRGDRLFAGRLLLENRADIERLLATPPGPPNRVTVGQRFRPLDARRKRSFMIVSIDGRLVVGDDGRRVQIARLLARYRQRPAHPRVPQAYVRA